MADSLPHVAQVMRPQVRKLEAGIKAEDGVGRGAAPSPVEHLDCPRGFAILLQRHSQAKVPIGRREERRGVGEGRDRRVERSPLLHLPSPGV